MRYAAEEKTNMASKKYKYEPRYDEEFLTREDQILIQLEVMMINNFFAGVVADEAKIIDVNAKLKYIASWLEKAKKQWPMMIKQLSIVSYQP